MSGLRAVAFAGVGLVLVVLLVAGAAGLALVSVFTGGDVTPSASATAAIPANMLTLYEEAATTCPGLPWTVLAAIGTVESGNGTSDLPGVHSGSNFAGAQGPMQFEPATFAEYELPVPAGGVDPPSPFDPTDAVYAAARLLCANGAAGGADLSAAVFTFNHDTNYVAQVLSLAQSYGQSAAGTVAASAAGGVAVDWALAQIGTPYIWGGETTGVGFDCSGLAQAAYKAAGITLPRVAQDQFDAGPQLPSGTPLDPGDLVFFGSGPGDVQHVGLYIGTQGDQAVMVDAPHTGADVRVEPFPSTVGASWGGGEDFVGATRPGG